MATETLVSTSQTTIETETLSIISHVNDYPRSPAPAVNFPDFLSGLLRSLLSGENQLGCPLPPEFCAALLHTDDFGCADKGQEEVFQPKGVPTYPLYKYIAHGLSEWIVAGVFPRTVEPVEGISEDEEKSAKIESWTQKVVELGGSLKELSQGVRFQIHCQEPYFSQLKDGVKTVEGRCATGNYSKIQVGDSLLVNQSLLLIVEDVKRYTTFKEMLEIEGLSSVLPGVTTVAEGVQVYRNFYSEAREKEAGVVGIHVRHLVNRRQPFELLHDLLKELHVEGTRALLGMRSTMGSIADTLPPPTSKLLSGFSLVNNETVPGSKLTVGARALSKHVHRCSNGWWGKFTGSEPAKNEVSLLKLRSMMEDAIWMNVHVVPVPVFEIRVEGGYGARWSLDGSQFRGFLEPPMEHGYLHKWRH